MDYEEFDDLEKQLHDNVFMESIDTREKISRFLVSTLGISETYARDDLVMKEILTQLIRENNPIANGMEQDIAVCLSEWGSDEAFGRGSTVNNVDNSFFDPMKAKLYIDTYWKSYNPAYPTFKGIGGDCTNFVSQVLHEGGMPMADEGAPDGYNTTQNWYCKPNTMARDGERRLSLSWKLGSIFKNYWINKCEMHMLLSNAEVMQNMTELSRQVYIGDVVQFCYANGNPWHTLVITGFSQDPDYNVRDIVLASHTIDSNSRSLYRTLLKQPQEYKLRFYIIRRRR